MQIDIVITAIKLIKHKTIVIAIYRPPSRNIEVFIEKLRQLIFVLNQEKLVKVFIAGDFNINFDVETKITKGIANVFLQ